MDTLRNKYSAEVTINTEGKLVLPGFINAHTHCQTSPTQCRGLGIETPGGIYSRLMPMKEMTPDEDRYSLAMACLLGDVRMGITTEVDQDFGESATARAVEEIGVRARLSHYVYCVDFQQTRVKGYTFSSEMEKKTFEKGLQFIQDWDGKGDGRITCDLAPHAPDTCTPEILAKIREAATRKDRRIAIHLAQSESEVREIRSRRARTPVEYLRDTEILGPDCSAAHCVYVTESDIKILAETDTKICHCPLDFARRGVTAPLIPWLQAGCTAAIALDGGQDLLEQARVAQIAAAFRKAHPGHCGILSAQRLLELITIDAANVIGMEKEIGSLEPGKRADVVLVDAAQPHLTPLLDPVANLVHFGKGSDVETVIIDGRIVVEKKRMRTLSESKALRRAQEAGKRAWASFYGTKDDSTESTGR